MFQEKPDLYRLMNRFRPIPRTPKIIPSHQRCSTCLETKLLNEFHLNKRTETGRFGICKLCLSTKRKPTHRYCKRCTDLKEIAYFNGASVVCHDCKKLQ